MKKIIFSLTCLLLFASAFGQEVNDPNAQLREAKDFHAIRLGSAFDVFLTQADEEKVAVSASESKYLEDITVEVKNGVLKIDWKNGKWRMGNKKLKAYISFKNIDKLEAGGACNVKIIGVLKAPELKIELSGASDLYGKLEATNLSFDLSGASDAKIQGTVNKLDIEARGASSFKGYDLITDYCNANASGASGISITVNKELSVIASGASDVHYKGNGVVREIKSSGASSISHRES